MQNLAYFFCGKWNGSAVSSKNLGLWPSSWLW